MQGQECAEKEDEVVDIGRGLTWIIGQFFINPGEDNVTSTLPQKQPASNTSADLYQLYVILRLRLVQESDQREGEPEILVWPTGQRCR